MEVFSDLYSFNLCRHRPFSYTLFIPDLDRKTYKNKRCLQPWKKVYRHLGNSLINSPRIDQNIILKVKGGYMMFLPYRCFKFSIFHALYTAFYFVKDDLVSHLLNKFAEPIILDICLLFCL